MDAERELFNSNPAESANLISQLFFLYMFPIFKKAYKYEITEDDLFRPLEQHKSAKLGSELEKIWYEEYQKHKKSALHRALFKMFGLKLTFYGMVSLVDQIMLIIVIPVCIHKIVSYFESDQTRVSKKEAYLYSTGLIACIVTDSLMSHPSYMGMQHIAMKIRVACSAFIYRKMLKFSRKALMETTVGQLINLLSNDVSKFDEAFVLVHFAWIGPIQVAVGTFMLYREIGLGAFYGIAFLVTFVPFQIWLAHRTSIIRMHTAIKTDERVRLMNEMLTGIQVIKLYCWEKPFSRLIKEARRAEIKEVLLHSYVIGIIYSFEIFVSRTSVFLSILGFVLLGNYVTAEKVFVVTAIYNCLRPTITMMFSLSISAVAAINISVIRIQSILEFDEFKKPELGHVLSYVSYEKPRRPENPKYPRTGVVFENVCAKWIDDTSEDTLINVSFSVTSQTLFAIVGPVGGGKSSIFSVILRELPVKSGIMEVVGTISYSSQEPWLFSGTVRDNILFGEKFNSVRYKQVLQVCALKRDLATLPFGDRTLVGERGKALSGGQKARVSLARCVYKVADIYLLDDPLSAVDATVGKHIYEQCIQSFLSEVICILVTHQLQFLKDAEQIMIIDDGEVQVIGTYDELQKSDESYVHIMENFVDLEDKEYRKSKQSSILLSEETEMDQILDRESFESGQISMDTYFTYFRSGGNFLAITFMFIVFVGNQLAANGGEYFLTYWVNLEQNYTTQILNNESNVEEIDRNTIIYYYTFITLGMIVFSIVKSVYFMTYLTVSSRNLHDMIYSRIQYATMRFYDTNPSGRILNRFSKDLGTVDEYIPSVLLDVFEIGLQLLGLIILSSIIEPYLLIVDGFLLIVFYLIRLVYVETSRNVKRIEAITKSPMFSHMTATIYGLDTIRAFSAEKMLVRQFDDLQDIHSSAWFLYMASGKCFGLWLDLTCQFFIACAIFAILIVNSDIQGGDMGLIITQYLCLMGNLQWGMHQWTELDNNMTSVERILEYTKLETEPVREKLRFLSTDWPEEGKIEFRNVSLRYTLNEPYVLKDLNFKVKATEKVGIVGRTGAGKSSIIAALFQLYPLEGSIFIDNMDTTKMPLEVVRSKISIIPQAPFLISGSMRENLDPFHEYSDDILWNVLEQVDLREELEEIPSGLNTMVSEGGNNFSVGQRQLVCLARALIRNNRILILDEATANVDPHTDALIQATIRTKFAHCTVLSIAHRLNTVMDADKILVMDGGTVIEFDHPYILLQNKEGVLRELVDATGVATAKYLELIAREGLIGQITEDLLNRVFLNTKKH